jgi:hypothetical protein
MRQSCERVAILRLRKSIRLLTMRTRKKRNWYSCAMMRGARRICSTAESFRPLTRSAPTARRKAQEKNVAAAKMRVAQARAQLADIDSQLAEMQIIAPADSILEVLSVKVGDVLPANREAPRCC